MALKTDGTVWAWGNNNVGQLGDETTINRNLPVQVKGLLDIIAIAAGGRPPYGYSHTVALKKDGTVWAWGSNSYGQLGNETNIHCSSCSNTLPLQVTGLNGVSKITAGSNYTLAIKQDGTVWAWGNNEGGQLGNGTNGDTFTPSQVIFPAGSQPTVTTGNADPITKDSATLKGTLNPNGLETKWYFKYGKSGAYGYKTTEENAGSGTAILAVTAQINGLIENTTYHFQLVAVNSVRTVYGNDQTFTTPVSGTPPVATTGTTNSIAANSAALYGTVNPKGSSTTYNFEYGLTTDYGSSTPAADAGSGTIIKSVAANLKGLYAGTTYNYRLVAWNSAGKTNGSNQTFTTSELPEKVNTYLILTDLSVPFIMPYGSYVQVFGSQGPNTINIQSGARVQCVNFVGSNIVNIQDATSDFAVYRSGATVYLNSYNKGTIIKIPATSTVQTLRFKDGSLTLVIINNKILLGTQEIVQMETQLSAPENTGDNSEGIF